MRIDAPSIEISPPGPRLTGGPWPVRTRAIVYLSVLAVAELSLFLFFVAGAHGWIVPLDQPGSTDFVSFHAAGALANQGVPWLAYDRAAHHLAEQAAVGEAIPYNYFCYPPIFLLLCAALARLPYLVAFILFQAAGAAACFLALRLIRRDLPLVVLLAFPGIWWAFGTGQNALLTAALFAAGTALIDRRPWLAGLCLGALSYKPHFGLLVPLALIAGGHWRAIAGAIVSVTALTAASAAGFGIATWQAFFAAAAGSADIYAGQAIFMSGLTSPYGVLMVLGFGRGAAFAVQAIVILGAAGLVAGVWRRKDTPLPIRAAVLLAATAIAVPIMMFYDLMLVLVALVWLTRVRRPDWVADGRPLWWTAGMIAVFMGPLFSGNLSSETHWTFAALTAMGAFALTLTAVWRPVFSPRLTAVRELTRAA